MANFIGMDPVAYSIDGGRHPADLLRTLAYAATQGSEGVIAPGDCRVRQLATAGPQVRMDSGAVSVRNRSLNIDNQTYIANNRVETRLDIDPTTTASRTDLVVVRIRDPQFSPWTNIVPVGVDKATFQYALPEIIKNVPAGTTKFSDVLPGQSGYALARVTLPPNTSAVTQAMITTLREVAVQRRRPFFQRRDLVSPTIEYSSTTTTDARKYPNAAADFVVPIPDFATKAVVRGTISSIKMVDGPYRGQWSVQFIGSGVSAADTFSTAETYANETEVGTSRLFYEVIDDVAIPDTMRGQTITAQMEFRRTSGTGRWMADFATQLTLSIDFYGAAI